MTGDLPDTSPPNPREERFRPMGEFLLAELVAVIILAALSLVADERVSGASGVGMIALLVAIPLLRVIWLVGRWYSRRDFRYSATGAFVLCVVLAGYLLSRLVS